MRSTPRPLTEEEKARRAEVQQRRREVLSALVVSVGGTFFLGLLPPLRMLWWANLFFDALLGGYIVLLMRLKSIEAERLAKLRYLPSAPAKKTQPAAHTEPSVVLHRSAN